MKKTLFCLIVIILLNACSSSEWEDDQEPRRQDEYSLKKIEYTLEDDNDITLTPHKIDAFEFSNYSSAAYTHEFAVDFHNNMEESCRFIFAEELPEEIADKEFFVQTPQNIDKNNKGSIFNIKRWSFSEQKQTRMKEEDITEQELKCGPHAKTTFSISCKKESAILSFVASFINMRTGEIIEVKGEWQGTLGFGDYYIEINEYPL